MGVNQFADMDDNNLLADDHCDGEDKWFPYWPTCQVRDMNVPCFVGHLESGSISSELLAAMLKHMDDCQVFIAPMGFHHFCCLMAIGAGLTSHSLSMPMMLHTYGKCALAFHMG